MVNLPKRPVTDPTFWDWWHVDVDVDASTPTVHQGDNDASVTGTIYGPKGEVLKKLRRPFGYGIRS